jgi:hypothetical protein
VTPYLPGYAGGELRAETMRWVSAHLDECETCRGVAGRHRMIAGALAEVARREVEPPAHLAGAVMSSVRERHRRMIPVPPLPPGELVRLIQDNREAITAAAGAVVAVAGVAWALWRALRSARPRTRTEPA